MKKKFSYLIAEIGLAHDGSLGIAKSFVKAFMNGADAVKFQYHNSLYGHQTKKNLEKNFLIKIRRKITGIEHHLKPKIGLI